VCDMRVRSYAVWWRGEDDRRHAGRLDLGRLHVLLAGSGNGSLAVPLREIDGVEYARGQITMHVQDGSTLRIGTLDAPGALRECAAELAARLDRG
jgi:hypothetical protein